MITKISLKILCGLLALAPIVKGQVTFQRSLGLAGLTTFGNSARQLTDSSYILTGTNVNPSTGQYCFYLVKTNKWGDTLWTRSYAAATDNQSYSVELATDGGFIMAGQTNVDSINIYVIKTNAFGDTLWTRTYGGPGKEYARSIKQTTDKGYIIAGWSSSYGAVNWDVYLIKTDSVGNVLWSKLYGGAGQDLGMDVEQTSDGGYIIGGRTKSFGAGDFDVYVIKTNSIGDTSWTRTLGGGNMDIASSIRQTTDGGYIITGTTNSFGAGSNDVYLIKLTNSGNISWSKVYGGINDDQSNSVQQTIDGGNILAGYNTDSLNINSNLFILKTDANGDTLWTKSYREPNLINVANSIHQSYDHGYLVCGIGIAQVNYIGLYLLKTDSLGNSICNQEKIKISVNSPATIVTNPNSQVLSATTNIKSVSTLTFIVPEVVTNYCSTNGIALENNTTYFKMYPNPSCGEVMIEYSLRSDTRLNITDLVGNLLMSQTIDFQENFSRISCWSLRNGFYFYSIIAEDRIIKSGKLIISR